ncbi:hypothetical protein GHT06_021627 [Daphnia sinensis]|uniref:Uncharacterized protein n=1 Tax=Daphnia sinensis TaxID=1820382 RepID=A0AAD5KJF4_9CRUS|nr:hypothetical protein GHT06_021627 [Daphnia sinensis]
MASTCRAKAATTFAALNQEVPESTKRVYTGGSKSMETDPTTTACAVYSLTLNFENAWTLTAGNSVFSAELIAIGQALKLVYNLDDHPAERFQLSNKNHNVSNPDQQRGGERRTGNDS